MPPRTAQVVLVLALALPFLTPADTARPAHATPPARHRTDFAFAADRASPARLDWRSPLDGGLRILRRFSPPPAPWLAGHRGVDLAAPAAAPVLAAGPGTIGYAGSVAGRGVVTVNHPGGLRTTYLPVTPAVRPGDPVSAGDHLGDLAPTPPHCLESCLHWGLREGKTYLDPLLLLSGPRVRLLPYWSSATSATSPAPPVTTSPLRRRPVTAPPPWHPPVTTSPPWHPPVTTSPAQVPESPVRGAPDSEPLPAFIPRSTAVPLPGPLALATLVVAPVLLVLLIRLLRTRARRPRGRHAARPPTGGGQHRKEPDRRDAAAHGEN
ncbi:peptidoglycan DD-metalloendopeptidase family protein [Nonomuraea sp. MCN248]|uniref:Peptidoglycan DD-metalloendopeptidase family protein n=1 Tax=Nonomuraea corallina TaxID=2989783 RepID=A0ABT4SDV0_9ACTN|nr:peptidoglycan DD-metalloendopeptidase family protein [Nonomuraea corallina]MDA0635377.1 peptidoglycan DD-metalloendopeptidase family protein [Nonomuraea corallina]